jgi:hypothetical protein
MHLLEVDVDEEMHRIARTREDISNIPVRD